MLELIVFALKIFKLLRFLACIFDAYSMDEVNCFINQPNDTISNLMTGIEWGGAGEGHTRC